jgi:hypothetical protein
MIKPIQLDHPPCEIRTVFVRIVLEEVVWYVDLLPVRCTRYMRMAWLTGRAGPCRLNSVRSHALRTVQSSRSGLIRTAQGHSTGGAVIQSVVVCTG